MAFTSTFSLENMHHGVRPERYVKCGNVYSIHIIQYVARNNLFGHLSPKTTHLPRGLFSGICRANKGGPKTLVPVTTRIMIQVAIITHGHKSFGLLSWIGKEILIFGGFDQSLCQLDRLAVAHYYTKQNPTTIALSKIDTGNN